MEAVGKKFLKTKVGEVIVKSKKMTETIRIARLEEFRDNPALRGTLLFGFLGYLIEEQEKRCRKVGGKAHYPHHGIRYLSAPDFFTGVSVRYRGPFRGAE